MAGDPITDDVLGMLDRIEADVPEECRAEQSVNWLLSYVRPLVAEVRRLRAEREQLTLRAAEIPALSCTLDEARWERDVALGKEPARGQALAEIARLVAECDALRSKLATAERERDEARLKYAHACGAGDAVLADLRDARTRLALVESQCEAAMGVVRAAVARDVAKDAQEAAKEIGAFAEEFMKWCEADDALTDAVVAFRSRTKEEQP